MGDVRSKEASDVRQRRPGAVGSDRLACALCWQSLHIGARPEDGSTLDRAGLPPRLGAWKEPGQFTEWLIGYVSMAREDWPAAARCRDVMPSGAAYRSGHVRARILPPHRQQIPHRSDPRLTISALWQSQKAARSSSIIRRSRRRRVWQVASDSYDYRRGWQRPDCRCGARRRGRRRRRSGRERRCRCRCSGCESGQCRAARGRGAASSADSGTDG